MASIGPLARVGHVVEGFLDELRAKQRENEPSAKASPITALLEGGSLPFMTPNWQIPSARSTSKTTAKASKTATTKTAAATTNATANAAAATANAAAPTAKLGICVGLDPASPSASSSSRCAASGAKNGERGADWIKDFSDASIMVKNFLDHEGWSTVQLEISAGTDGLEVQTVSIASSAGRSRLSQALQGAEELTARVRVSSHLSDLSALRVRILALEVTKNPAGGESATAGPSHRRGGDEDNPWLLWPWDPEEGFFGFLPTDEIPTSLLDTPGAPLELYPIGSTLRARLMRLDSADSQHKRTLRSSDCSALLSLTLPRLPLVRPLGPLYFVDRPTSSSTTSSSSSSSVLEWPPDGFLAWALASPEARGGNRSNLSRRAAHLGVSNLHGSLIEDRTPSQSSKGLLWSSRQSQSWADRRVREGVALAKSGNQQGALDRYNAAIDLWPQHKEGLIARGAALVHLGRPKEAIQDFDSALSLDPEDPNAQKYRNIAKKRLLAEARPTEKNSKIRRTMR